MKMMEGRGDVMDAYRQEPNWSPRGSKGVKKRGMRRGVKYKSHPCLLRFYGPAE